MNQMSSEKDLIQRSRQFEEAALAEIYNRYSPGLYRYAMALLENDSLAEDCLAGTFLRYLQALRSNGGPQDYLQAYLYRIAHNLITDHYRSEPPPLTLLEDLPGNEDDLVKTVIDRIEEEDVRMAIVLLTPEQRHHRLCPTGPRPGHPGPVCAGSSPGYLAFSHPGL